MAILFDLAERDPEWSAWLAERPAEIRALIDRYPPNRLYRMEDGHRVTIEAYSEGGTVTVRVSGQYNFVMFERGVFGIDPATLVECDLPGPGELLGAMLTTRREIKQHLARMRADMKRQMKRAARLH
jgi:hypothetical protein